MFKVSETKKIKAQTCSVALAQMRCVRLFPILVRAFEIYSLCCRQTRRHVLSYLTMLLAKRLFRQGAFEGVSVNFAKLDYTEVRLQTFTS